MSVTRNFLAPNLAAAYSITSITGTTYISDANGVIANVAPQDVPSLEQAGCVPFIQEAPVTLALSTAAGVYVVEGQLNLIPVSTIAAVALLAAPTKIGETTKLIALSTGNFVITSSGCSLKDEKGGSATVLTCTTGTAVLVATGSTTFQILNRSIVSNSSVAVTYGIASS